MDFHPVPGERHTETIRKIAERLRGLREMRGLTAQALAGLARFDVSQYCRIERGETNPRMSTLDEIARALGVQTRELLIDEEHSHINVRRVQQEAIDSEHHLASLLVAVGQRIRATRKDLGLTQKDLAERADSAHEVVSRIERGAANPVVTTLDRFAEALGLEFQDLFVTPDVGRKKERA